MTFTELVAEVAEETGMPRRIVAPVLRGFLHVLAKTVLTGVSVSIAGFGVFYQVKLKRKDAFGHKMKDRTLVRFKESRYGKFRGPKARLLGGQKTQVPLLQEEKSPRREGPLSNLRSSEAALLPRAQTSTADPSPSVPPKTEE